MQAEESETAMKTRRRIIDALERSPSSGLRILSFIGLAFAPPITVLTDALYVSSAPEWYWYYCSIACELSWTCAIGAGVSALLVWYVMEHEA